MASRDYLQRYLGGGSGSSCSDYAKGKKEKKRHKHSSDDKRSHKHKRRRKKSNSNNHGSARVVDNDHDWHDSVQSKEKLDEAWSSDDQPVVVPQNNAHGQEARAAPVHAPGTVTGSWSSAGAGSGESARANAGAGANVSVTRSMRHDSHDDSDGDASPPRRRAVRHDSDDDSDGDASPPRRSAAPGSVLVAHGASSSSASVVSPSLAPDAGASGPQMTSGHTAGLLNASSFATEAETLRRRKENEMRGADDDLMGRNAETVIRDRRGRKLDMLEEMMRQERARKGEEVKGKMEQYEWGTGEVQKQEKLDRAAEAAEVAAQPFARSVNDPKLEAMLKSRVRSGDPMAHLLGAGEDLTQQSAPGSAAAHRSTRTDKPVYKGPPPAPNRFGILPGYRWDGVDRGNGWEERVAQQRNAASVKASQAQAWSCADM